MEIKKMLDLTEKRQALKVELRETEQELTQALWDFEGSVQDALMAGIVRPNFSVPPGFTAMLAGKQDNLRR